jgi:hypothetical protein
LVRSTSEFRPETPQSKPSPKDRRR